MSGLIEKTIGALLAEAARRHPGRDAVVFPEAGIRAFCLEALARFKAPRFIRFVEEFPMTVTGKIQKFKMREAMIEELGLESAAKIETA